MQTTARLSGRYQPTLIDRAAVLDRVGGDHELLRDIIGIFLTEYPALLGQIQEAIAERDARKLERAAHSLKGAVSNFGAQAATEASYRLELIGRRGQLEEAPAALSELLAQFQQLQPLLEDLTA